MVRWLILFAVVGLIICGASAITTLTMDDAMVLDLGQAGAKIEITPEMSERAAEALYGHPSHDGGRVNIPRKMFK